MKRLLYITLIIIGVTISGCSDYLDVNTNPNQPVSSTPELVLSNALNVTGQRIGHNELGSYWSGQWSPSGSFSGFIGERTYNITATFRTNIWTGPYDNLADYKVIEETAKAAGKSSIVGMARVMKAFNYQIIVDAYGNAPYREALQGTANLLPAYDNAAVIYDSLLNDLEIAKDYLAVPISGTNPSAGEYDIVFKGNTVLWTKFANALKLRLLLRISGTRNVAAEVAAIAVTAEPEKVFLGVGEDVMANPGFVRSAGKMNAFYENFGYTAGNSRAGNHDAYAVNSFLIDELKALSDPRLSTIAAASTAHGTYVGVPLGAQGLDVLFPEISGIGSAALPTDQTAASSELFKRSNVLMSAAESFFLQAEAVQRGFYAGDAQKLYEAGIAESFKINGISSDDLDAEVAAYIIQPGVDFTNAANDKLELIRIQKWIALANFNGFEAWTEFRRTGVPNVPLSEQPSGSGHPVRLIYPQSEYSNNSTNANAQGVINQFTSKIFWDVN